MVNLVDIQLLSKKHRKMDYYVLELTEEMEKDYNCTMRKET